MAVSQIVMWTPKGATQPLLWSCLSPLMHQVITLVEDCVVEIRRGLSQCSSCCREVSLVHRWRCHLHFWPCWSRAASPAVAR